MQGAPGSGKRWIGPVMGLCWRLPAVAAGPTPSRISRSARPIGSMAIGTTRSSRPPTRQPGSRPGGRGSYDGRATANGEIYDVDALTAAHRPAAAEPGAGDQSRQRPEPRAPGQRPRPLRQQPSDRSVPGGGARARLRGPGPRRVHVQYLGLARLDDKPIRPGEQRTYVAATCPLPQVEQLVC